MTQLSFGDMEYANHRRKTRREAFLEQMDKIIPWADRAALTASHCPSGKRGRPPLGVETDAAHVPYAELVRLVR